MGVGIETWRLRIVSFLQLGAFYYGVVHLSGIARHSCIVLCLAYVIVLLKLLLSVGGVELNPGSALKMMTLCSAKITYFVSYMTPVLHCWQRLMNPRDLLSDFSTVKH